MSKVSKHGNYFEILSKLMNLGRRIEITCRKVESKDAKLRIFIQQLGLMDDYVECMEEVMDEAPDK